MALCPVGLGVQDLLQLELLVVLNQNIFAWSNTVVAISMSQTTSTMSTRDNGLLNLELLTGNDDKCAYTYELMVADKNNCWSKPRMLPLSGQQLSELLTGKDVQ